MLRNYLSRLHIRYDWVFGLVLILLFGIPRFAAVLNSYVGGSYATVVAIFFVMWFTPFILLDKSGRKEIGLKRPDHYGKLLLTFITGIAVCLLIYLFFRLIYGHSLNNAFVYIAGNNTAATSMTSADRAIYFWVSVIPTMLFSPIGEEFLYRGVIHGSFVKRLGERGASVIDSMAFALTHIAHFGILYVAGVWEFVTMPSLLWVLSMYTACRIFFLCKQYTNSIWGAVTAHSGFNFAMMYIIFYHIL